jgi:hypothetical protein
MDPLTHEKVPPLRLATLGFGRDDGAGNDTRACIEYGQARPEAPLEPEIVDDLAALLDAAGESMRHAGD